MNTKPTFVNGFILGSLSLLISASCGCSSGFNLSPLAFFRNPFADTTAFEEETQVAAIEEVDESVEPNEEETTEAPEAAVAVAEQDDQEKPENSEERIASQEYPNTTEAATFVKASNSTAPWQEPNKVAEEPKTEAPKVERQTVAKEPWTVNQPSQKLAYKRSIESPARTDTLVAGQPTAETKATRADENQWQGSNETASPYAQPIRGSSFVR